MKAQYVFLHDAILEGITTGGTEIPVNNLACHMKELETPDVVDGETGYQKEFSVCTLMYIQYVGIICGLYCSDGPAEHCPKVIVTCSLFFMLASILSSKAFVIFT